jgi:hypothetical protein
MNPYSWCAINGVPHLAESLARELATDGIYAMQLPINESEVGSEGRQQSLVRLEAAQKDILLWRNNVGALRDDRGVPVRYGLANDSKAMNEVLKSADLIGIRKVVIQPYMVGWVIGQFVSREMKELGWKFNPKDKRESAQQTWGNLINSYGGDAMFATGPGTL